MAAQRTAALALAAGLSLAAPHARAGDAPDQSGRPTALIFATTFGFYQGIAATWLLTEHDILTDGEAVLGFGSLLTLGSTLGTFAVANHVTKKYGISESQASLYNSSLFWAVLNGAGGGLAADTDTSGMLWSTLATGWSGQALGILLAANAGRTSGQVGMINSSGTWIGAETLVIMAAAGAEDRYSLVGTLAADLGLGLGVLLSRPDAFGRGVSAERMRLVDLGALAGGLGAPAALFMIYGPEDHLREWYLSAVAVGIPAGIATAWYLTRHYDPEPDGAGEQPTARQAPLMFPLAGGIF